MSGLLIEGGLIVPVDGRTRHLRDGWILVADGRIAAMGDGPAPFGNGATRINASSMAVLPGLIDAHTHLGPTGIFRGFAEDMTSPAFLSLVAPILENAFGDEDYVAAARLGALECLKGGTTCASELGLSMDPVARAVEEVGIRCSLGPDISDITGFTDYVSGGSRFDEALGEQVLARARDVFARWHGAAGGRITVRLANFSALTCTPELLRKTRVLADELGVGIDIHVLASPEAVERGRAHFGTDTMVALADLGYLGPDVSLVHLLHPTDADIAAVAASGAMMVECPMAFAKAGRAAPVGRIRAAGVPIAVGSDWLMMDLWQQMRCAMMLARLDAQDSPVVDSLAGLEMGTILAARAVGLGDEIGSLEPGKKADIILIDLDQPHFMPLGAAWDPITTIMHNATARDVTTVIVDGEILFDNHQATRVDEAEVMATASRHGNAVMARAGRGG